MEKFGIRILEGYGATECAPVLSVNTPMAYRTGTVGPLLPGLEFTLSKLQGISRGGMLSVRGPNVMKGYYLFDDPGVLKPPAGGWYSTGDVVEIDADGFVHILKRVKRFAKIAGEMVSLEVVEQIANLASPARQHAATTQTDPKRGENILLFTTDPTLSREALTAAARELGSLNLPWPARLCQWQNCRCWVLAKRIRHTKADGGDRQINVCGCSCRRLRIDHFCQLN
jgi:acyl-[acyl-carrier-protein]-phospholipid O-acyltransferase/long-chain-fatty-acid--[acyl-carrier-protein] ligase